MATPFDPSISSSPQITRLPPGSQWSQNKGTANPIQTPHRGILPTDMCSAKAQRGDFGYAPHDAKSPPLQLTPSQQAYNKNLVQKLLERTDPFHEPPPFSTIRNRNGEVLGGLSRFPQTEAEFIQQLCAAGDLNPESHPVVVSLAEQDDHPETPHFPDRLEVGKWMKVGKGRVKKLEPETVTHAGLGADGRPILVVEHKLRIRHPETGEERDVTYFDIKNVKDGSTLPGETTQALHEIMGIPADTLPVVNCEYGRGRSATLFTQLVAKNYIDQHIGDPALSVEKIQRYVAGIFEGIRHCRGASTLPSANQNGNTLEFALRYFLQLRPAAGSPVPPVPHGVPLAHPLLVQVGA